ncbi:MAG: beta-propeller domain-containing protein [Deltaproteobacteria bacterium]|nr:beta-propeller domain-containing protein [Deltaproteobacteria bacterium]
MKNILSGTIIGGFSLLLVTLSACNATMEDDVDQVIIDPDQPQVRIDYKDGPSNCERLDQYLNGFKEAGTNVPTSNPVASSPMNQSDGATASSEPVNDTSSDNGPEEMPGSPLQVREADIVKVDGNRIYLVRQKAGDSNSSLMLYHLENEQFFLQDSLNIRGLSKEFHLKGDTLLIIGESNNRSFETKLTLIKQDQKGRLVVQQETNLSKARYITSRTVGSTAYIVLESSLPVLPPFCSCERTLVPYEEKSSESKRLTMTTVPSQNRLISILSFEMEQEKPDLSARSVVIQGTNPIVSVNEESIYIGTSLMRGDYSQIFKFGLNKEGTEVSFEAAGMIPGHLSTAFVGGEYNDQFSMDEYEGYLRVATTSGQLRRSGRSGTESSLFVLKQEGEELKMVGTLRDLHAGEAIYAVRFVGDRGYVVTFKKIDPLFIIDLSNPENPEKVGELEVPGFSTYLKPLDEHHLLTIGKEADDQESFAWFLGVKLSLFDVSDPSKPQLVDSVVIGERGTESEALRDHRAFNYFSERNLLAIPVDLVVTTPNNDEGWRSVGTVDHSEEQIWKVDPSKGFTFIGAIRHDDLLNNETPAQCYDWDRPYTERATLRRALEVDDQLVTLSDKGLKSNSFEDLAEISSILFPQDG